MVAIYKSTTRCHKRAGNERPAGFTATFYSAQIENNSTVKGSSAFKAAKRKEIKHKLNEKQTTTPFAVFLKTRFNLKSVY